METLLAAAQIPSSPGDVAANVRVHEAAAAAAADEGARCVVFPELSLTGYEMDRAADLAFTPTDGRLDSLRELARRRSVTLAVGAPVRLDDHLHLGLLILGADGSTDVYTKHFLGTFGVEAAVDGRIPRGEPTVFVPGTHAPVLRIEGERMAFAICADTGRPAHAAAATARGATVYLASLFVIPSLAARELDGLSVRAREQGILVLAANHAGPSGGLSSAGSSSAWAPDGRLLARAPASGPALVLAGRAGGAWTARTVPLERLPVG